MAGVQTVAGCPLLERIGEGGIADVFRSEWEGRTIALKVLRETDRVSMTKRFLREGRLLRRLQHPGLVRCHHVIEGAQPALVLELLKGRSLDERLAHKPLSGDEAVHTAAAVLRVLQFLHENGIVHRDVKSSNVFLADDHRVVMMDLGLAVDPADPLTTTLGDVLGTYAYMAPEQIAGAQSDHRTDLYSLGITLYEAVCGTRPFQARGAAAWLAAHRAGGATPLIEVASNIPIRLASLVDRLMARDPAARPPSAAVALALLTGESGAQRDLRPPPILGRSGARGAIEAVVDAGGWLRISGPEGSGFGAIARIAREIASEQSIDAISIRGRQRMRPDDLYQAFAGELARFGMGVRPDATGVERALSTLGAEGRVLVVVEDIDALSDSTALVVAALARIPGLATLHLGLELAELEGARPLELRSLTGREIGQLIAAMVDSPTAPVGLEQALLAASGGVPAMAVALLREQAASGALWCEGRTGEGQLAWRWDQSGGLLPGESTRRLLARSLARLSDEGRPAMDALAVAGAPVPVDILLAAIGGDRSGADLGPLQRLGFASIWSDAGDEWIALSRAALEAVILSELPPARRKAMHAALAVAARARGSGEWEQRFLVLHDALGTGGAAEVKQLVELGEFLAKSGRPWTAMQTIEQIGSAADHDPALTARRALARAEALRGLGRMREAREALNAGERLAHDLSLDALCTRAESLGVEIDVAAGMQVDPRRLDRVEQLASMNDEYGLLAIGEWAARHGQIARAEALLRACVASQPPIDRLAVQARLALVDLALLRGATDDAERMVLGLVRELRGRERRIALAESFIRLAMVQRVRGQFGRALESVELSAESARRSDVSARLTAAELVRAWVAIGAGDVVLAERLLERASAAADATSPWYLRALYHEVVAEDRHRRGDASAALAAHVVGHDAALNAGDAVRTAFHSGVAGVLTATAKQVTEAVEALGSIGAHRHLAQLMLAGALVGRDREILQAAEHEARLAGDPLVLLEVLHAERASVRVGEARAIARRLVDGLQGSLAESLRERPSMRWALG